MTNLFSKEKKAEQSGDQYIRFVKDLPVMPIGLSICDYLSRNPGPSLQRVFDAGVERHTLIFSRHPDELLCQGAAVGIDGDDLCRHISSAVSFQGFAGFCEKNQDGGKVSVTAQGCFLLSVPRAYDEAIGRDVFARGPNEFSLSSSSGWRMGKIIYIEKPGRAMIAFQKFNSEKKMVIDYRQKTVRFV